MDAIISIVISVSVFVFFLLVVVKNMKKKNTVNTARERQGTPKQTDAGADNEPPLQQEGVPTVKKVRATQKNKPHTFIELQTTPEEEDIEADLLPDFTNEEDIRKAIIATEILERKYD